MKHEAAGNAATEAGAASRLRLPDSVSSAQDLQALVLEIHQYAKWLAHESIKKRVSANGTESKPASNASEQPPLTPAANQTIDNWAADGKGGRRDIDPTLLDGLIEALEDFRDHAPTLTIVLAAPPAGGTKKTLVAWCRQNIDPGVLVSFEFNSTILGGMVVRNGSRIYDWSFRRQILQNRQQIPEALRNVR